MEKSEILEFVKQIKAKDHVIMFYSKFEDKHHVLCGESIKLPKEHGLKSSKYNIKRCFCQFSEVEV